MEERCLVPFCLSRKSLASLRRFAGIVLLFCGLYGMCAPQAGAQSLHFRSAQVAVGSGWQTPVAAAADAQGNLFIADSARAEIDEIQATGQRLPAAATPVAVISYAALGAGSSPAALAVDGKGNLYVADKGTGSVIEIEASSPGVFSSSPVCATLASGLTAPSGIAVDASGNLFVAQQAASSTAIVEIEASSVGVFAASPSMTTIATGRAWNLPTALALDASGNLYVAESGSGSVQQVAKSGGYSTITQFASGFASLSSLTVDASGNLLATDASSGTVTEFVAVNGVLSATATSVQLGTGWSRPASITADAVGNLFVADAGNAKPVQQLNTNFANFGAVQMGAKSATVTVLVSFSASATTGVPSLLTGGASGLDFSDAGTGSCTTNAGTAWSSGATCTLDLVYQPQAAGTQNGAAVLVGSGGGVLVSVPLSGYALGPVAAFAPGAAAGLTVSGLTSNAINGAGNPAFDGKGNLYVVDPGDARILKLSAPLGTSVTASVIALGGYAPNAVAIDGAGNLYIASNGNYIQKYSTAGVLSLLANNGLNYTSASVAVDAAGNVYTADTLHNRILEFPAGGAAKVFYAGGALNMPYGLAADALGNLYVANEGGNNVVRISQGQATILSATYLNNGGTISYEEPMGIALDAVGNVYVADTGNDRMVMIPADGSTAFALNVGSSKVSLPLGVAVDRSGNLAISDAGDSNLWLDAQQTPAPVQFADTAVGSTSAATSVALLNLGNQPLTLAVPASDSNPALTGEFALASSSTCPTISSSGVAQSLSAGSSCTLDLTFSPVVQGSLSGSLSLADNAPNTPQSISLSGKGIAATIVIAPSAGTLTDGKVEAAYSQQFTASGGISPYTYALNVVSGSLPAGLSFNTATGLLSGTPTATGTVVFNLTATDSSPSSMGGPFTSSAQSYTLQIATTTITVTPAALGNCTAGVACSTSFAASGGKAPYAITLGSGSLPPGLALVNGVLSGTPTQAGSFTFTITATDANQVAGNHDYTMTVNAPSLAVWPGSSVLDDAMVGNAYSQQFTASGGNTPYSFAISGGALPAGLALAANGLLSGSPAATGNFTFTVQVTDSTTGSAAPFTATRSYSMTVYPPIISVVPLEGHLSAGKVGETNYVLTFTARGGSGVYSYAVTSGALPTGMSLVNGALAGVPTAVGVYTFTITATDSNLFTGSKTYHLTIDSPEIDITPTTATLAVGTAESAYASVSFGATSGDGGTAPYALAMTAGTLPTGMSFSAGVLSGTPLTAGTYYLTVTATDAYSQTGSRTYALTILPPPVALATTQLYDGAVGIPYSQSLTAAGGSGTYVYTSSTLPSWLALDDNGLLHGTPQAGDAGYASFTVTATDSYGFAASRIYTLNVYALAVETSGVQNMGTVLVGGTPSTTTITFRMNGNYALAATPFAVLTEGVAGQDFTASDSSACAASTSGANGKSCSVNLAFAPAAAGQRLGVVQLVDANGNVLGSRMIYGNGKGAVANFLPGIESSVSTSSVLKTPQSLAIDDFGTLYLSDAGNNQVLKIASGSSSVLMDGSSGLGTPAGVAIDGAGNLFIADSAANTIWEIAAGATAPFAVLSNTVNPPSSPLSAPQGVAVDGAGNLYVADTGNSRVLVSQLSDSGYGTPTALSTATALQSPVALAVTHTGAIYIADKAASAILIEPNEGTSTTLGTGGNEKLLTSGVHAPTGIAVDVNGNALVANSGSANVVRLSLKDDASVIATTATLASVAGVAVDASGSIYISDSTAGVVYAENYIMPPAVLNFATTTSVGSKDEADGAKSFTVYNSGNSTLTFASETGISDSTGSYLLDGLTNCIGLQSTLAANASCVFAVDFAPQTAASPLTAALNLAYNNLASNVSASVALTGTSVSGFIFSPAAGALPAGSVGAAYAQTIAVTSGGTSPYTYTVSAGALPSGLTLSSAGALGGTPLYAGDYAFTVQATDSTGIVGTVAYTLTIASDAGSTSTSNSSTQQTVTFTFTNNETVAQVLVLTQGVTGLDFTDAGTGSCETTTPATFTTGQSCTVVVNFQARYPGTRYGAVELLDASGDLLATSYITGVGSGPLALFSPGVSSPVSISGLSTGSSLDFPAGEAVDPQGNLYVADAQHHRVLKIASGGAASEVATGSIALDYPTGVALDGAGNLYIADSSNGRVIEVARNSTSSQNLAHVLDNNALVLTENFSVAVDGAGNVYTTDLGSTAQSIPARIIEYPQGGAAQVVSISGATLNEPFGLAADGSGTLWIADLDTLYAVRSGTATALASTTLAKALSAPVMLAADGPGNLYIADGGNNRVLLLPAGATDLGSALTLDTGAGDLPFGLAIGGAGDLYVSSAAADSIVHSQQQSPSGLAFDAALGSTSADQTMMLLNAGNSALTIAASSSAADPAFGKSPSSFALDAAATTCAQIAAGGSDATLAAGVSCKYALNYTAAAASVVSDTLTLTDNSNNASGATQTIALAGETVTVLPNSGTPTVAYALAVGTADASYNAALAATFSATGGTPDYCFEVVAGALPAGMEVSPLGILWGTPHTAGSYTFTVQATDSLGQTGTQVYSLTINPATLTISPASGSALPTGTVLAAYGQAFTATGGTAPYTFELTSGSLPKGLVLSTGGLLTGVAQSSAAALAFTVEVIDAYGQTATASYTLTINPPPVVLAPASGALPSGTALLVYNQIFTATGGTQPYTYAVTSGALPAGLSLDAASGLLAGVAQPEGDFSFTITATDSSSGGPFTAAQSYTLHMGAPVVALAPASIPDGAVGEVYSQQFQAGGGSGSYAYTVTTGVVPSGLTLSSGTLSGTPTVGGVKNFTLTATDTITGASAAQAYTPTIYPAPATATPVDFGSVLPVGTWSSSTATVTFHFHGSSIVNGFAVVSEGESYLEFKWAHSGSCTYTEYDDGDSCTLDFRFRPLYPGQRLGAVELLDESGNILGTGLVSGTGAAAVASISPGTESTLASASSSTALGKPQGIAVDAAGNAYVADASQHAVFKITSSGAASKVVVLDATARPVAVALDGAGNLYVADAANATLWMQAAPYAAAPVAILSPSVNPPAAGLTSLGGVTIDASGNLYFSDPAANLVYQSVWTESGYATPVAIGTATTLSAPSAVAVDASGKLYIADAGNNRVVVETLSGVTSSNEAILSAGVSAPSSVVVDVLGNVYIANGGTGTALKAVLGNSTYATPVAIATASSLQSIAGLALDGRGNLFLSDAASSLLLKQDYGSPRTHVFTKKTIVGNTDTVDGSVSYTLFNAGNQMLNAAGSGVTLGSDFTLLSTSGTVADCASNFMLAPNAACNLSVEFTPVNYGSLYESIVLSDNSMTDGTSTQSIGLEATGLPVLSITWAGPAAIAYGTALSSVQLNASSGAVDGTFVYSPAAGAILNAGTQTLLATFTPADTDDYGVVTVSVPITVNQTTTSTTLAASINPSLYSTPVTLTATVTPGGGTATGTVNFLDGSTLIGSGVLNGGVATLKISTLSATIHSLTAVYGGDNNCTGSSSAALSEQVIDFSVTSASPNSTVQTVSPLGTANYSLSITPSAGVTLPDLTTLSVSGLPLAATVTLTASGWVQQSSTSWILPAHTPLGTVDLTIQLHKLSGANQPVSRPSSWMRTGLPMLLCLLLLPFAGRLRRSGRQLGRMLPLLVLALVALLAGSLSGCSADTILTPRTYDVLVNVQTGALSHTTTLTLTVN